MLIIGGCGFIGKKVAELLINDGVPIVIFDLNANQILSHPGCIFIQGRLSDRAKLEEIIQRECITHVIHLVSSTLPKNSNDDKSYDLSSNVIQSLHLLDLCVKYKLKKILFMSSGGTVYGIPNMTPVDESHPNNPICSYGISKLAIEKYLFLYQHLYGLNYVALRPANPYGPGQKPGSGQGAVANFVNKIITNQPIEIWGDGSIVRDYFYVQDLAVLTKLALFSPENGVFNAGSGIGLSLNELIKIIEAVVDRSSKIIYMEQRKLDVPSIVLNCAAAHKKFGWRSNTSLQAGIEEYIRWYRMSYLVH